MQHWKTQVAGAVLIVAMAVLLGVEASRFPRHPSPPSTVASTPFPIALHSCEPTAAMSDNIGVIQRADGSFSACLRVGALQPGGYQITARRLGKGAPSSGAINPHGDWMSLTPASGPPGTVVRVSGNVAGLSADQRRADAHLDFCWAGCDALVGWVAVDWSATEPGRFTTEFTAPAAPWFAGNIVAPLRAGRYAVIMPCTAGIQKPSGACPGPTLEANFELTGPGSNLCVGSAPCAALRATPTSGPPGALVAVDGWAPLTGLNDNSFLSIDLGSQPPGKPGFENFSPLVASVPFTVTAAPPWNSLPALRPVSVQRTGMDAIGVDPSNSNRFAYCAYGAIEITSNGGRSWSAVSLDGVRTASAATTYPIPNPYSGATRPTCDAVALDARYPGTVYAVFDAVQGSPPPFYFVAYVTRNSGRTWQAVPVPDGSEMGRFGGFRVNGTSAQALFWKKNDTGVYDPTGFIAWETGDGGRSWSPGPLHCPAAGPCIALGPQDNSRCQAVGEWESIQISTSGGRSFSIPRWPGRLSACTTSELVGLASGDIAALDGASPYPMLLSTDSGTSWWAVALPPVPGQSAFGGCCQAVLMLPDGRLLAVGDSWYVLNAGAAQWCRASSTPAAMIAYPPTPTPELIRDRLWWIDTNRNGPGAYLSTPKSLAISAVHC